MNLYADIAARISDALEAMKREGALPADLEIKGIEATPPRDATTSRCAAWAASCARAGRR